MAAWSLISVAGTAWAGPALAACCLALVAALWSRTFRPALCLAAFFAVLLAGPGIGMVIGGLVGTVVLLIIRPAPDRVTCLLCALMGSATGGTVLLASAAQFGWPVEAGYLAALGTGGVLALAFCQGYALIAAASLALAGLTVVGAQPAYSLGLAGFAVALATWHASPLQRNYLE